MKIDDHFFAITGAVFLICLIVSGLYFLKVYDESHAGCASKDVLSSRY